MTHFFTTFIELWRLPKDALLFHVLMSQFVGLIVIAVINCDTKQDHTCFLKRRALELKISCDKIQMEKVSKLKMAYNIYLSFS